MLIRAEPRPTFSIYWYILLPPFVLKQKVGPKIQGEIDAELYSVELFLSRFRRLGPELSRPLSVVQQARRYESFRLKTLCRVGD